jgi:DNA uptake protein ComE-like DNA-binding protein
MFTPKVISGCALFCLATVQLVGLAGCSSKSANVNANSAVVANANANAIAVASPAANAAPQAKVNLNTATQADLLRVMPNLGSRMLHEFEEYKPYRSIQQFRKEIGKYVDQTQVAEYEKFVFVPIDPNQSDAATLQQIPGLDANEAQELIAGRPYDSADAFLDKLKGKVSAEELEIASSYLAR